MNRIANITFTGDPATISHLESPRIGTPLHEDGTHVRGWVIANDGAVRCMELRSNGVAIVRMPVEIHRADIEQKFITHPYSRNSGYAAVIDIAEIPTGSVLELFAITERFGERAIAKIEIGACTSEEQAIHSAIYGNEDESFEDGLYRLSQQMENLVASKAVLWKNIRSLKQQIFRMDSR